MSSINWTEQPSDLELSATEVHVWRARLDFDRTGLTLAHEMLSDQERERAARVRFREDRSRFIAARASLRSILASYTWRPPAQIAFRQGPSGKPALDADEPSGVRFNMSHSKGLGLIGITFSEELGVDVEWIDPRFEYENILAQLVPKAAAWLTDVPARDRRPRFFASWVRMEACMKAKATGFGSPVDEETAAVVRDRFRRTSRNSFGHCRGFTMWDFDAATGYPASVVVRGHKSSMRCFEYRFNSATNLAGSKGRT